MNKKAIWAIIGLMSLAVIGVVWLQMSLIQTSMKVNEEKFDKNVFNALNAVVNRLEYNEKREAFHLHGNGYSINYLSSDLQGLAGSNNVNGGKVDFSFKQVVGQPGALDRLMADVLDFGICTNCLRKRDEKIQRLMMYNTRNDFVPLEERIKLEQLDKALRQELENQGINTDFNYGVFSKRRKSFVIVDNYYVVEEPQPDDGQYGFKNLFSSGYQVHLFPEDQASPGLLMIHFPSKTSVVWSSLWLNFLGTILFTAIILLCFAYTIQVIFQQKKISEMKTDFINNMTHEFKTPIATISLAADSITSPMISGNVDKVQRFAGIIKQENKRMNNQVEKVLQMARIDKREYSLKLSPVNLHDIIEHAVENITLQVEKKDGIVSTELEATNPVVEGDMTHISNVINNLLDNANKYSPEKPEISVHTRNLANGVEVIVMDRGIGMSKEARKHIFDKFYRVHTGNLHDVKGFGLGLSYVKAMMTAHKGEIDVKSEPGKGSSFALFFPYQVETKH